MLVETTQPAALPERRKRNFLAEDFTPTSWELIAPYYQNLEERNILSLADLKQWLRDSSELESAIGESGRWIYVRSTIDTSDTAAKAELTNLYTTIYPKVTVADQKLKEKFVACAFAEQLDKDLFFTTVRKLKESLELYREENIALNSEMQMKQSTYDQITGAQSIVYNGVELTPKQAEVYMRSSDRTQRQESFKLIAERKLQDADKLDELFSQLIQLRHQMAVNAGCKNYIEFRFKELGRFDYTPEDCLQFHSSVKEVIMPLVNQLSKERKEKLGVENLKLWDLLVDSSGKPPLKPCHSTNELIDKSIACFNQLDPYFGERIEIMKRMNYLDLDSRLHKSNGGYNMTMPELGVPFIFMNSSNSEQDLIVMVHEGGHAIHTFLAHDLELHAFKESPSEISEVASMGMELMSMEHWDIFYSDADDLKRARKNHLNHILTVLTKTCLGDSFQFWLYSNPNHTIEERRNKWVELVKQFTPDNIDGRGEEAYQQISYQSILHFFIVPFYYIEYAFAELGAIALWRNFKRNPKQAVIDYKKGLALGFTKPIPVFYETVGAKFDFSKPYIAELVEFLQGELKKL
jgi:oligoendopeptidase F